MNAKLMLVWPSAFSMIVVLGALTGCVVPPPPPPGASVTVGFSPDYCFWDGDDYFGWYGGEYYYWGGGTWVVADHDRLDRIHRWEGDHPDWRSHATDLRMEPQQRTHLQPQEQPHPVSAPPAHHYFHPSAPSGGSPHGSAGGGGHDRR